MPTIKADECSMRETKAMASDVIFLGLQLLSIQDVLLDDIVPNTWLRIRTHISL